MAQSEDEVLEITRVFEAPRPLVFRMWADEGHRLRWWGPEGHGLSASALDFRVGGKWSVTIANPDGSEAPMHGVFTEIREPSRLCFTYVFEDVGIDSLVEIDFIERGPERTEMRFRQAPFPNAEERASHSWGWNSALVNFTAELQRLLLGLPATPRRLDGQAADVIAARERQRAAESDRGRREAETRR